MSSAAEPAAKVIDLRIRLAAGGPRVVDGVSFTVGAGELLRLVGESGSGKTTVALALLGHVRRGLGFEGGQVRLAGTDVLSASPKALRRLRDAEVAYVPQDPGSALNPGLKVHTQLTEGMRAHPDALAAKRLGAPEARLAELLDEVGLGDMPRLLEAYPHELSGAPSSASSVSLTATAAVYVSHDLAVVANLADSLMVLYAGQTMESGQTTTVFDTPAHPYYAQRLLRASPSPERAAVLEAIPEDRPPRKVGESAACSPRAARWSSRSAVRQPSRSSRFPTVISFFAGGSRRALQP